jgi:hypothetical protein
MNNFVSCWWSPLISTATSAPTAPDRKSVATETLLVLKVSKKLPAKGRRKGRGEPPASQALLYNLVELAEEEMK